MKSYFLVILLVLLCQNSWVQAQKGQNNKLLRNQIDSLRKQKFMEKVNVDEATADRFFELFKENNKKIRVFNKERKEILQSIEDNPDALDIDIKINNLLELETKIVEQRKTFMTDLKSILTLPQIAKTIILQKNFNKQFKREILKQRKKSRKEDN